jgi:hypothetical protein
VMLTRGFAAQFGGCGYKVRHDSHPRAPFEISNYIEVTE